MAAFEISTFILAVLISIALIFFVIWNVSGELYLKNTSNLTSSLLFAYFVS